MSLAVGNATISKRVLFNMKDSEPLVAQRIVKVGVSNTDTSAMAGDCVACVTSVNSGDPSDDAPLKWAGIDGFTRPILPGQTVELDICGILDDGGIELHTLSDIRPRHRWHLPPDNFTIGVRTIGVRLVCGSTGQVLDFSVDVSVPAPSVSFGG